MINIINVCSLGFNCHIASMLKINNLKFVSYPFDWIMSGLDVVKTCLQDDFKTYLDKDSYIEGKNKNSCGHKIFKYNMFAHHNPLHNIADYEYFSRCVSRFRELLASDNNKLFIVSIINGEHGVGNKLSETLIEEFIGLNNILNDVTKHSYLLVVVNYPNKQENKKTVKIINNLYIMEIDTLSSNNGVGYTNPQDNKFLINVINDLFTFI
jgi:hypothetical protein